MLLATKTDGNPCPRDCAAGGKKWDTAKGMVRMPRKVLTWLVYVLLLGTRVNAGVDGNDEPFGRKQGIHVSLADAKYAHRVPAVCAPTEGMWHLMIIWGHGLQHDVEIWKAIHAVDGVNLVYQKEVQLPSVDAAIDEIYHADIARVGKGHIAAKSKFLFKLPNANTVRVLVMYDTTPKVKTEGEGKWQAKVNHRMVKLKWDLRKRFNPKLTPNGKRNSYGVYSHNHIVHISDTDEGVDDLLRFFKLPMTGTLIRSHREFMTPWHIGVPASYGTRDADLRTLVVGCAVPVGACGKKDQKVDDGVLVADSAHFAFASGRNQSEYAAYYRAGIDSNDLSDDHTPDAFAALQRHFDPSGYPACICGFDGLKRRSMIVVKGRRIFDGAHRAALMLAANGGKATVVKVVDLLLSGGHMERCGQAIGQPTHGLDMTCLCAEWNEPGPHRGARYCDLESWYGKSSGGKRWVRGVSGCQKGCTLRRIGGREGCFSRDPVNVGKIAAQCQISTGKHFACDARHSFHMPSYEKFCQDGDVPKGELCAHDFAIGVISSAKTNERLALLSEHWVLDALEAGAAVRIFFAAKPDLSRIPTSLHKFIIVLGMTESEHHFATKATLEMNARMLEEFPGRKWYVKMDDDTFFMLPNLVRFMNRHIRARRKWRDKSMPFLADPFQRSIVLGKALFRGTHISGGAGYVQSAFALRKAVPAIRANVNNCTKGYVPSEDIVITCVHKALKSKIVNVPGMYINTVASVAKGEYADAASEGVVKYPITFHWVHAPKDACPMLACYFCTEHVTTDAARHHSSGFPPAYCPRRLASSDSTIRSACRHLFTPFRPTCPRYFVGDRTKFSGFGQQVYELMFLVQAAAKSSAVPVFEPFASSATDAKWLNKTGHKAHHGHYEWANELFGLSALFEEFAAVSPPSSGSSLTGAKHMKELAGLKHRSGRCEEHDQDCCGVYLTQLPCAANCWIGGALLAADEFASCARIASPILGAWVQQSPFARQKHKTVNVVVHLRVGDSGGVWPTYKHLVAALAPVCAAYRCAMHLIGGGDKTLAGKKETAGKVGDSVESALRGFLRKWGLTSHVISHTGSATEALLMMMHADVLVSSGSSFPIVASVFSDVPVLIDWRGGKSAAFGEPVTTHFLQGSVLVDISGKLSRAAVFQLHTSLLPKMWRRGFHRLSLNDEKKFFPSLMTKQSATYKQLADVPCATSGCRKLNPLSNLLLLAAMIFVQIRIQ